MQGALFVLVMVIKLGIKFLIIRKITFKNQIDSPQWVPFINQFPLFIHRFLAINERASNPFMTSK